MTAETRWPVGPLVVLAAAIVGVLLGLYGYVAPLTGITGSAGALLVIGSSVALVLDAVILWRADGGSVFWIFWVLGLLGALGTIAAAAFLHAWWLVGANVIVLLGLLVALARPRRTKRTLA